MILIGSHFRFGFSWDVANLLVRNGPWLCRLFSHSKTTIIQLDDRLIQLSQLTGGESLEALAKYNTEFYPNPLPSGYLYFMFCSHSIRAVLRIDTYLPVLSESFTHSDTSILLLQIQPHVSLSYSSWSSLSHIETYLFIFDQIVSNNLIWALPKIWLVYNSVCYLLLINASWNLL